MFLDENILISINISSKFIPKNQINNIPALSPGRRKPLSEPLMIIILSHLCVTRPQWINFTLEPDVQYNDKY